MWLRILFIVINIAHRNIFGKIEFTTLNITCTGIYIYIYIYISETGVVKCICAHESAVLVLLSKISKTKMPTKVLEWAHKQFVITEHRLLYFFRNNEHINRDTKAVFIHGSLIGFQLALWEPSHKGL